MDQKIINAKCMDLQQGGVRNRGEATNVEFLYTVRGDAAIVCFSNVGYFYQRCDTADVGNVNIRKRNSTLGNHLAKLVQRVQVFAGRH